MFSHQVHAQHYIGVLHYEQNFSSVISLDAISHMMVLMPVFVIILHGLEY